MESACPKPTAGMTSQGENVHSAAKVSCWFVLASLLSQFSEAGIRSDQFGGERTVLSVKGSRRKTQPFNSQHSDKQKLLPGEGHAQIS